ncbi:hypothetical protein MUK42_05448 [Musa troglodytarum]|uniref:Uncharacterized protein n=1 Tax=Musa troglodytarum TaxID=320322 RepID=A0A9E7EZP7_9LILI|nr:hypothetical protein MUK42_05448 [Musa troglodytarum]
MSCGGSNQKWMLWSRRLHIIFPSHLADLLKLDWTQAGPTQPKPAQLKLAQIKPPPGTINKPPFLSRSRSREQWLSVPFPPPPSDRSHMRLRFLLFLVDDLRHDRRRDEALRGLADKSVMASRRSKSSAEAFGGCGLDDLKALQKNSGAAVSNELVKDGRHLTDVAWKATMDLVVGDDDDGDSRVVEVVEQMRGKTIIVQEYGVELLIEERFLEVIESKVEVRKRWAMSKNRPTKRLLLASSSWSLRQEMVWEMRPQKRYGVDMEEAAPIKRSSSIGRYPTILTSLRSTLTMTLIKVSSSVVVQKTL